jgi:hypothetical protein
MSFGAEIDEDATAFLSGIRDTGDCDSALVAADKMACAVESAFVRVRGYSDGRLSYEAIAPQNVKILYPLYIEDENGEERAPDYDDIYDAAAIIVRLGYSGCDTREQQWIAYIGRCEEYPLGRCVSYTAAADSWHNIPPVGSPGARDVYEGDSVCNPLTLMTYAPGGQGSGTEYPLVLVRGGHVSGYVHPVPTITSLYESCVEITMAWSRALKDSLSGMLGREVIKNPDGAPLPEVCEGLIALKRGQEFEVKTMNSGSVTAAIDAIYAATGAVAAGWNVPPYTVVSRIGATPESGIALVVQTAPLVQFLAHRDRVNSDFMARLFDVESALLLYHTGSEAFAADDTVSWVPGRIRVPQDTSALTQSVIAQLDAGIIDAVEAVRILSDLATAEEAEAQLTVRRERAATNSRIAQAAPRPALPPRVRP